MTHPHTAGRTESPRAIETNGEGQQTTAHLNLSVDMTGQVDDDLERIRKASPEYAKRRYERQPKIQFAGSER